MNGAAIFAIALAGCARETPSVAIDRPYIQPVTLAVAPILNFSGEFNLDPVKAADLLASELSYVDGVSVLPVNRVIAALASQGVDQVESPAHALAIADAVGADAILVAGITEYDAYTPVVGIVVQMYAPQSRTTPAFNAVSASRLAQPFAVTRMADPLLPTSQHQMVYNASHENVREKVRLYAKPRTESDAILGWRQYLKVQTLYLRFCWNDALKRLMNQERTRRTFLAVRTETEEPSYE